MMGFSHSLAPEFLRTLALSLVHFLWQGAALAALAAAALAATRHAATRYVIGLLSLVAMLAAPVLTFLVLGPATPVTTPIMQISASPSSHILSLRAPLAPAAPSPASFLSGSALNLLVGFWFAGVLLFSLRTAGGFFLIARMRRRDARLVNSELLALCREMQVRLGITRTIRFCQSLHLDAPAVLGWFRPVVLLPMSALTGLTEAQLRAVLAHELAHIRRLDAFFNLLQVAAETILFYHPAVWWLNKRIRAERENCCDDVALAVCGNPAEYARALAQMEQWRMAPSLAMAANRGPLASRVARLLGLPENGNNLRNAGIAFGTLCLAIALVAGNAFFGLVRTASAHSVQLLAAALPASRPMPQSAATPKPSPAPAATNSPDAQSPSYIDSMQSAGLTNLSAEELISLKVQDITPQYIQQIRATGLRPTVDELVGLKVQGITPEYIQQVRDLKLDADLDQIIGMKVQDITPEYIAEIRKLGFQPDVDQLIGMKVQGITPEFVAEMRKLGFQPDADQLIGMKVQGITPQYVQELSSLGIKPDADTVIGLKVQGIDAAYVSSIRSTGLNPDGDEWVGLKVQDINADYIKSLQSSGFKPAVDEVIGAKVMGITPQFIDLAKSHGFKDLDLEKLIELKQANVLE